MNWSLIHLGIALAASPLLLSVINRTKAFFGGRKGQPLLQPYYDLIKLFRKGAVYSTTTSWIFKAGPMAGFSVIILILLLLPLGVFPSVISFQGDLILLIYLLGLMRFFYVLAALDTGSSFEGMGASREMFFAPFCELALILSLSAVARASHNNSLTGMMLGLGGVVTGQKLQLMIFTGVALLIVLLTENARIPVDDPNTHLELTMIHEVMVLDHCGTDLGFIHYTACLKLWISSALLVSTVQQVRSGTVVLDFFLYLAGMFAVALVVGIIESVMARLRLNKIPLMVTAAIVFAVLALIIPVR